MDKLMAVADHLVFSLWSDMSQYPIVADKIIPADMPDTEAGTVYKVIAEQGVGKLPVRGMVEAEALRRGVSTDYITRLSFRSRHETPQALEAYAAEIAMIRQEWPNIRVVVYDHSFEGDRAWFRFAFKWSDPNTGELRSRAGMQSYRIEAGKLAETWWMLRPLGSAWTDAIAQEHWTSARRIR